VPDGVIAAFCPEDWLLSETAGVADEALLSDDWVVLVELVHPAIMMPAIRIAEAISMSVMLFFMEFTLVVRLSPHGRNAGRRSPEGIVPAVRETSLFLIGRCPPAGPAAVMPVREGLSSFSYSPWKGEHSPFSSPLVSLIFTAWPG
jgi:hypothetical protein